MKDANPMPSENFGGLHEGLSPEAGELRHYLPNAPEGGLNQALPQAKSPARVGGMGLVEKLDRGVLSFAERATAYLFVIGVPSALIGAVIKFGKPFGSSHWNWAEITLASLGCVVVLAVGISMLMIGYSLVSKPKEPAQTPSGHFPPSDGWAFTQINDQLKALEKRMTEAEESVSNSHARIDHANRRFDAQLREVGDNFTAEIRKRFEEHEPLKNAVLALTEARRIAPLLAEAEEIEATAVEALGELERATSKADMQPALVRLGQAQAEARRMASVMDFHMNARTNLTMGQMSDLQRARQHGRWAAGQAKEPAMRLRSQVDEINRCWRP